MPGSCAPASAAIRRHTSPTSNNKPSDSKLCHPKEKLTEAVVANQPSSAATGPSCDGGKGFDLDIKSKLGELADETPGSRLGGAVIEVIGAEILVPSAVPEHVVDRGQYRSGHGTQRLLGATAAAQAIELSLEIAALLAGCTQAHWTSTVLSHGAPLRRRADRRLPALSSLRGQSPAQDNRWAALGKRLISH